MELDDTLLALTHNGTIRINVPTGNSPTELAFDGAHIWVTNYEDGTVSGYAAASGALLATFPTGKGPQGVLFDGSAIWIANSNNATVTKIRVNH